MEQPDILTLFTHSPYMQTLPSTSKGINTSLEVQDPLQRKIRRDTEGVPFAITSRDFQKIGEKACLKVRGRN